MSSIRHLSDHEFAGYKPAQEEGSEASDWLASEEGHAWQDSRFFANSVVATALHGGTGASGGAFYSLKTTDPNTLAGSGGNYSEKNGPGGYRGGYSIRHEDSTEMTAFPGRHEPGSPPDYWGKD